MGVKALVGASVAVAVVLSLTALSRIVQAQGAGGTSLTGTVTAQSEGALEGVLVTAKKEGSTITMTVVTNAQGQYSFPRNRLAAGKYAIAIRASGYELPALTTVEVGAQAAELDLTLNKVTDPVKLAAHLTSIEWYQSMPGTQEQKDAFVRRAVNCGFCHTMEKVARSKYTAQQWLPVIKRMASYDADRSSGEARGRAQELLGGKAGFDGYGNPITEWWGIPQEQMAEQLARLNLSGGKTTWSYPLKTLPRPKGRATRVIVTVYPIPRQPSVIHDLDIDSKGNVWYGNSGWDFFGRLDPKTGTFSEWPLPPRSQPGGTQGTGDVQPDADDNVWLAWEGKPVKFDVKTEKFVFPYTIPAGIGCGLGHPRRGFDIFWTGGGIQRSKTNSNDPIAASYGSVTALCRINVKTGKVDAFPLYDDAPKGPHRPYQMDMDSQGNAYSLDWGALWETPGESHYVLRIDGKTGAVKFFPTPTAKAFPRRGGIDAQDRFWFGEFWGDAIGMFDTKTQTFKEFPIDIKYISPYGARADKTGNVWASSNGPDRVIRLDPKTGEVTTYLMPEYYDSRKLVVDPSSSGVTVWVASKNTSQLVRIEAQD